MSSPSRTARTTAAVLVVVVTLAGLGGRAALPEAVGAPLGDCLYAALVVLVVALARPRTTPVAAAGVALAVCAAIELSHLTDVPAGLLERFPLLRFVLGTTFGAPDLAWYALGAAVGAVLLRLTTPRATDRSPLDPATGSRRARALLLLPLGVVVAAGGALGWFVRTEEQDLTAQVAVARGTLDDSEDRVVSDRVRTALAGSIHDARTVLAQTPILDRLPGDATRVRERLERDVAAVEESRLAFALGEAGGARDDLEPVVRRAEQVLAATEGLGAGEDVRSALRAALESARGEVAATAPERLAEAGTAEVERATAILATRRTDLHRATRDLVTAQDAVTCPYPDQLWFPEAGRLDAADLAPIPWAPQHSVRADLLPGLEALNDAYRAQFGRDLPVNSAYRTYDEQVAVYNPADPNPLAAPPGCSNHGLGTAIDLSVGPQGFDSPQYAWLKANGERFGWVHPDWAGPDGRLPEPWHWQSVKTPVEH